MKTIKQISKLTDTSKLASELEKEAYSSFFNEIVPKAEEEFLKTGGLSSVFLIGLKENSKVKFTLVPPTIMELLMRNSASKDILAGILNVIAKKRDTVCICMIAEAWKVAGDVNKTTEENMRELGSPSKNPDREEICIFTFESENIIATKNNLIIRKDDKVSLEVGKTEESGQVEGRFTGFLKDLKKTNEN